MFGYIKFAISIFIVLSASRFIPHPPNFTSLIALSFYVPAYFGSKFTPVVLISFAITDFFLGFHSILLFTWMSVLIIGFSSKYLRFKISHRLIGVFSAAIFFYLFTNFGVWLNGMYEFNLNGLLTSYTMALPFFYNTLLSTLIYSILLEVIIKIYSQIKISYN